MEEKPLGQAVIPTEAMPTGICYARTASSFCKAACLGLVPGAGALVLTARAVVLGKEIEAWYDMQSWAEYAFHNGRFTKVSLQSICRSIYQSIYRSIDLLIY
eukprot:2744808-Rhodomonas_salina.3